LSYINIYDVVIGNKKLQNMTLKRKIVSFGYRCLVKILFNLPLHDTQSGIKVFCRYAIPEFYIDGFGFDLEMLYKINKNKFSIKEVIVNVSTTKGASIKSIIETFLETLRIRFGKI
jgi:hypothetical protein